MQRLARTQLTVENQKSVTLYQEFRNVKQLLSRHLPPSNLQVFAEPIVHNNIVEWYSTLEGQPQLVTEENKSLNQNIDAKLQAIKNVLLQLQQSQEISPVQTDVILAMLSSLQVSSKSVYTINNDPVIVGWGLEEHRIDLNPSAASEIPEQQEKKTSFFSKHRLCCWLLPLLLFLLGLLLWWWFCLRLPEPIPTPPPVETKVEEKVEEKIIEPPKSEEVPPAVEKEESPPNIEPPVVEEVKPEIIEPAKSEVIEPTKPTPICTKTVKPTERPQMVMIFDNSTSMLTSLLESDVSIAAFYQRWDMLGFIPPEELEYLRREPRRLTVAKKATSSIIDKIDPNIDIGLISLNHCPSATNSGFYSPNKRKSLKNKIKKMYPDENHHIGGTPLYSGLEKAASMVDGVKREAFILLISDGEDTCQQGDVCLLAEEIAIQKPKLKINVVDIGNAQAANCAARATGGKVFSANNQAQVSRMINQAIKPMEEKEECKESN